MAAAALAAWLTGLGLAQAAIVITVDKSTQHLSVAVDGAPRYEWPVSTARWGYHTPNGTYRPQRLERQWYSRKYDMSPMPYSIFFEGGYAIHGSYEISHIGRPASHGCVRLHPENAAVLFRLVERNLDDTRIVVTGERPSREEVERSSHRQREAERPSRRRREAEVAHSSRHRRAIEDERAWRLARSLNRRRLHTARAYRQHRTFEEVFTDEPTADALPEDGSVRRGW